MNDVAIQPLTFRGAGAVAIFPMMTKTLLPWCLALAAPFAIQAYVQGQSLDSLRNELKIARSDTDSLRTLVEMLSWLHINERIEPGKLALHVADRCLARLPKDRPKFLRSKVLICDLISGGFRSKGALDSAGAYLERGLGYAREAGDTKGESELTNSMANLVYMRGDLETAQALMQKTLSIRLASGDTADIASTYLNLAAFAQMLGNIPEAIDLCIKARRIAERTGQKDVIGMVHMNMANLYNSQGQMDSAMISFKRAIPILAETRTNEALVYAYNNLATIQLSLRDHDGSEQSIRQGLELASELGYDNARCDLYMKLSRHHELKGELDDAFIAGKRAVAIADSASYNRALGQGYMQLMRVEQLRGNYREALRYSKLSEESGGREVEVTLKMERAKILAMVHEGLGDYRQAYEQYKHFRVLQDSIYNENLQKDLVRRTTQFEYEKKEALIRAEQDKQEALAREEIEKQKLMRNAYAATGLLSVLLLMGLYRRYRYKQRMNRELEEKNTVILREKQRSEELLLNILPEEVAEELKEKGEAKAVQIDMVTVLFTDFKGFTTLSETLSPQELVRDLNECFSAFDRITGKYGIEKIKTIGDAYMAAGGLPTPNSTHAIDVVQAALEMRDFIAEGKMRKLQAGAPYFEIRIGIHTGPVVAGIVGVKKFQYDIWGDTVNTASRMESSGEVGQVNISESTYGLVKDVHDLAFTPRGMVQAKGKGELEMFFVRRNSEVV